METLFLFFLCILDAIIDCAWGNPENVEPRKFMRSLYFWGESLHCARTARYF